MACHSNAAHFSGPVISVLDGDTLEVLHSNHAERIRLNGIDCPEKGQAFGKVANLAAFELSMVGGGVRGKIAGPWCHERRRASKDHKQRVFRHI